MKIITLTVDIPEDREVTIKLPPDVPVGTAEVTVVAGPSEPPKHRTLGDLLGSGFAGSWVDRDDITDSVEYAAELRRRAWGAPDDADEPDR